jgi:medium-chain acyl-[acyl-carrier-protein] hydrolase
MSNLYSNEKTAQLILTMPCKVTSADADMNSRLRLGALSDFLIQSAINSAERLQTGFGDLRQQKLFWVLSRMTIEIIKPLMWNETGEVETWPKNVEKIIYYRDFFVRNQEQEVVAKATSGWLAIEFETKRPKTVKDGMTDLFSELKDRHALTAPPEKLFPVKEGEFSEIKTTFFDIDLNGHVTSTRYVDWMMDTFPIEFHKNAYPKLLSVNYLNETRINETIQLTKKSIDGKTFLFQGFNKSRDVIAFNGKIGF